MNPAAPQHFLFVRRLPPLPQGEWGGMEKLMLDWFERVDTRNAKITLVVTADWVKRFREEAARRNIELQVVEISFEFPVRFRERFRVFSALLKSLKPSCVVFFQGWFAEFAIPELLASWIQTGGRVYIHENLGPEEPPEKTSRWYFGVVPGMGLWWHRQRFRINGRAHLCRAVLVVSRELKERYVQWWGYPSWKVKVTYHGVDIGKYSPSPEVRVALRAQLGISPSETVILTTARFTRQKRLERVIEAFDLIAQERNNVRLMMAGTGPLESELKKLAASLPSADRIKFLGQLADPSEYLKMSDVFVLSSDNEGLSLALLEAMATGLICVSTDCVGSTEVIDDGVNGYLVDKNTKSVCDGLRRALDMSGKEREEIKRNGVGFVREKFDIEKNVRDLFKSIGLACKSTDLTSEVRKL